DNFKAGKQPKMERSLSQPLQPDTAKKKKLLRQRGGYACWPGYKPRSIFGSKKEEAEAPTN
ncbi:MAG: hypothetical protein ACYT04_71805, partial [Nostoc sp.]